MAMLASDFKGGLENVGANTSSSGGNGLGQIAGLYLADKLGFIDLNNKHDLESIKKHGLLGGMAVNKLSGAVPPKQLAPVSDAVAKPVDQIQGAVPPAQVEVGGPMNQQLPQGQPLPPMQMENAEMPTQESFNDLDSDIGNFASLFTSFLGA